MNLSSKSIPIQPWAVWPRNLSFIPSEGKCSQAGCQGPSPWGKMAEGKLTTHLHLVPRLRMGGAILPLPPIFMVWSWCRYGDITLTTPPSQRCTAYRIVEVELHSLSSLVLDVSFMAWLLYLQGKWFWNPLNRRLGEPYSQYGHFGNRFIHPNWKSNKNSSAVQPLALSPHWLCYPGSGHVIWTIQADITETPTRKPTIRVGPQIGECHMEEDGMKVSAAEDKGEVW